MSTNFKGLANKVCVIKRDVENLSEMVKSLPKMMEKEIYNAKLASERLLSGTSNLDGNDNFSTINRMEEIENIS